MNISYDAILFPYRDTNEVLYILLILMGINLILQVLGEDGILEDSMKIIRTYYRY